MMAGARVLVTGAAGFLGANLVRRLIADGASVRAVVRPTSSQWRLEDVIPRITLLPVDIRDLPSYRVMDGVDVIFHLAAAAVDQRSSDIRGMIETNVLGTSAVLELAERLRVRRLVHVGSSGEYGPVEGASEDQAPQPNAEYGATKAAATLLVGAFSRRSGISAITLRPFSVFGPLEAAWRLVPYCVLRALDDQPLELTDGRQRRDFVFVDDVVEAMVAAAIAEGEGIVNVCTGVATSVHDMAMTIIRLSGSRSEPLFGARAHHATEMWMTSGRPERAASVLDWRPRSSLDEGVSKTIEWMRSARQRYPHVYSV
ncbi:MAG TPA: NAD-dependent epimerase/dehydratase family protein [Vicinamibacterales bacterium]|nr:NAD-dependent epimerase/dehydratase family protein [Vicinamibacterales bacterium]